MENGLNEENLFFDTYALIEIFNGNKNYERYKKVGAVTSYFHLYELYYNLKKDHEEKIFYDFFLFLTGLCVNLNFGWIKEAVEFKIKYKKNDLSYADCIGYIIAKNIGVKFLTGDKEFEDMENVEFVKK